MESNSQKRPLVDCSDEVDIIREMYADEIRKMFILSIISLLVFVFGLFIINWDVPITFMVTFIAGGCGIIFSIILAIVYAKCQQGVKIFTYRNNEITWAYLVNVHVTKTVYGIPVDKSEFYKLVVVLNNSKNCTLNLREGSVHVIKKMAEKMPDIKYGYH